ncbi:unnamed protein product [Ceutorhynchus assimilis]|uniref:Vitellogenin n=1 Tax=Ceutorhynchus assimilis TaxID=467358 RepID=A0A9N9M900_9CUCU|nr:unnamed protein product [Ceutorhynchus assimilis]
MLFFVLVGLAVASTNPAWKDNTEYVYDVNGRTLTSLHDAADQYSGIFLKAKLHVSPRSDGKLQARISEPMYAQIQSHLPDGWKSEVPESQISYKPLALSQNPFQMTLENGLIKCLTVEKELTNWEANLIKSIVSQFQLDVQGQNAIRSPMNSFPSHGRMDGVFKTMEETITGESETLYDIHPLPEYLLQSKPWLAPQQDLRGNGDVFEVIKTKNFTNSEERPSYHYGFGQAEESEPTSNNMGQFLIRESSSRAILTGKLSRFVIQNSFTVNKIMVNPTLENEQMGSVVSMVNVTLRKVETQRKQPEELSNPIEIGDLVYTYEKPKNNQAHPKLQKQWQEDDSSSEESNEGAWRRFRRSASQLIKKQSDESSSEEELQQQPKPQMSKAPESPLLPFTMGYHGKSIKQNRDFDLKQNVEKLVKEMSEEVQEPEKILKESTLNKYTMLCNLVRLMDKEEIESVAQKMYTQKQQEDERQAWEIYRDAVAEAGTGPAFSTIQQWIQTKKIQKREAAEVVMSMAQAVRVPTEEYMREFFELVKNHQVKEQQALNESSILAYTNLVHKVYINRNESHNQYPVHAFGSFFTKEGREFVKQTVIPHFAEKLEEAISNADARKIHVYTKALGNIGHKQILEVFEPYLEGDKQCSQFQRFWMVVSLERLVSNEPELSRSVLYKIYQNTAETPEIRVAAVLLIMSTNPPVEMLQRMAQSTNFDRQVQVNAAVKSAIESASNLKSLNSQELKQAAQAAKPLLTREEYGANQGFLSLSNYVSEQMNIEFQQDVAVIASQDSNWPLSVAFKTGGYMNGMKQASSFIGGKVSSLRELASVWYKQTEQYRQDQSQRSQQQSNDNQWSSASIAKLMGYETEEKEQLEGVIMTHMGDLQRLWSFDNQTLEQLPEVIREQEENLKNGKHFNYVKFMQHKEMSLSFPTEMGIPFVYSYELPMLTKFQGKLKAVATPKISRNNKLQKPEQISAQIEASVTISGKAQSHLSFVTPFDHEIYMAGYDRNLLVHVPISAKVEIDAKNNEAKIEFEVREAGQESRIAHFGSYPYTSRSNIMTIKPVSQRPNTQLIKESLNQHRAFDILFGKKETGLAFRAWGHHPQQSASLVQLAQTIQSEGFLNAWDQLWDKDAMQYTEVNIAFIPKKSTVRKIALRTRYDQDYKRQPEIKKEQDFLKLNELASKTEPKQRQQEFMKHVGSGIKSAQLASADISIEVDGEKQHQYVLGLAYAKSNADPSSRVLAYYKNKDQDKQACIEVQAHIPNTNGLDLTESLKTEPTAKYNVRVQHGQNGNDLTKISAKWELSRSHARKEYLVNQEPLYRECKKEMQERNFQLSACQNMTIRANFLDHIKYQIKHENLNKRFAEAIEDMFKAARVFAYPMTEIESASTEENLVQGTIQFQPEDFRQVNVTLRTKDEETKFFNISIQHEVAQAMLVSHPVFHLRARLAGVAQGNQNIRPTCMIDQTAAQTFNNKTYSMYLSSQYTVVMQYTPKQARENGDDQQQSVEEKLKQQVENYVVLARQVSGEEKELRMTFNHPKTQGKTVQIDMKPKRGQNSAQNPAATVLVDGKEVQFDDQQIADLHKGFVEIYALPNGEVKVEIQNAFYMIFDGQRVKLTATSSKLRDSISGLCGRFSDDQQEDFTVPANCVVRDDQKFVESYQIDKTEQRRQQRSGEWNQECVEKVLPVHANVISHRDAGRTGNRHQQGSNQGPKLRNRYIESNGEICFTIKPIPTCNQSARKTVSQNVPVHCIQGTKTAYYLKSQIDQGGNPDFSRKSETKKMRIEEHVHCN